MPNKEHIFLGLCEELLDYNEHDLIEKCGRWGLEQYGQLERHNKILVSGNASDQGYFIYGTAFAVIIGEFGRKAFNNYFSDGCEIDLDGLGLDFRDIAGYVQEDMKAERRDLLQQSNYVDLQDIWSSVGEWKHHIHKSLAEIRAIEDKDPDWTIYASLKKLFEPVEPSDTGRMTAYEYISNDFSY